MFHHNKPRILFLIKENNDYGTYTSVKSGLLNSCKLLVKALLHYHVIQEGKIAICVDGNQIDKEVHNFRPDICIIEALWVSAEKLKQNIRLHPKVKFIVRVHSNIPFLATEGMAIKLLKEYGRIPGAVVSFNNKDTNDYVRRIFHSPAYLPNIDMAIPLENNHQSPHGEINIGCFGAVRPLKNQLIQALAAINYGDRHHKKVNFHINYTRPEQQGENILKNLRSLFEGSGHKLVEHKWMSHAEFIELIATMDLGLQVSFTESFNIVTADFVNAGVPIIVSHDITWMNEAAMAKTTDAFDIENKIEEVMFDRKWFVRRAQAAISIYNKNAIAAWRNYLCE